MIKQIKSAKKLGTLVLLVAGFALGPTAHAKLERIPDSDLDTYKQATLLAIPQLPKGTCYWMGPNPNEPVNGFAYKFPYRLVQAATEAYWDIEQNLIVFIGRGEPLKKHVAKFRISDDPSQFAGWQFETHVWKQINAGTIAHPRFESDYFMNPELSYTCPGFNTNSKRNKSRQ